MAYAVIAFAALGLAYLARYDFRVGILSRPEFWTALLVLLAVRLAVNYKLRLGMSRWRFVGVRDLVRLLAAETLGSLVFWALTWWVPIIPSVGRSIILLEWVFNGYLTGGLWLTYRLIYEKVQVRKGGALRRVLIVGAGEAGAQLVHQMQRSSVGLVPVGFVDDDPFKWGTLVHGVEVVGAVDVLGDVAADTLAEEILLAVPAASVGQIRRIVESCERTSLPMKILPNLDAALSGEVNLDSIRDVQVEDLLGRDPIELELPELAREVGSRSVLVTGAAGSIGSELVRQIAYHCPGRLILMDQAETPLFFLESSVRRDFPGVDVVCVIGDVTRAEVVENVFARYRPDKVFHAAAYKHVPIMECNPREAVRTNVIGTYLVAEACGRFGTTTFVLVSTDKAVEPANVMGATKNLAEQVVVGLQERFHGCSYSAVRFGNVLGSNGSVIPVFREQLRQGRPLTVTHEDVTRYFMTIPEAVQLILQASLLPDLRGRVAMLDMGEPVRILDLARDLLRLSGRLFRMGDTVMISGLRPGEKLHEELAAPDEEVSPTDISRVFVIGASVDHKWGLGDVWEAIEEGDLERLVSWLYSRFSTLDRRKHSRESDSAVPVTIQY